MTGQTVILSTPAARKRAHWLIEQAPQGAVVNVREGKRSLDQNARMWAMLSDVSQQAKHNGRKYSPDVWKVLFMSALGVEAQFTVGLNSEPVPLGFRSSKLTKSQMIELQDFIEAWAAQNGVTLHQEETA